MGVLDYDVTDCEDSIPDERLSKVDTKRPKNIVGSDLYEKSYDKWLSPLNEIVRLRTGVDGNNLGKIVSEGAAHSNPTSYMQTNFNRIVDYLCGDFCEYDSEKREPLRKDLVESLKGNIVVDLGAGESNLGYVIAQLGGARAYVGVEPNFSNRLRASIYDGGFNVDLRKPFAEYPNSEKLIPYSVVNSDMLSFLRAIEGDQVSMIAAGIDDSVIHDGKYEADVKVEINRTLAKSGGFLSIRSEIYFGKESGKKIYLSNNGSYVGSNVVLFRGGDGE